MYWMEGHILIGGELKLNKVCLDFIPPIVSGKSNDKLITNT